jgi:hypothetical protein
LHNVQGHLLASKAVLLGLSRAWLARGVQVEMIAGHVRNVSTFEATEREDEITLPFLIYSLQFLYHLKCSVHHGQESPKSISQDSRPNLRGMTFAVQEVLLEGKTAHRPSNTGIGKQYSNNQRDDWSLLRR